MVLDEAFDGLDEGSREELKAALAAAADSATLVQIAHRAEDLVAPTMGIVLDGGTATVGAWADVSGRAEAVMAREAELEDGAPPAKPDPSSVGRGARKGWSRRGLAQDLASAEVVRFEDVSVSYGGAKVLDGLSFFVKAGETCALLGPNGSGKSTVVDLITG